MENKIFGTADYEFTFVNQYTQGWSDYGSGGDLDFSSWVPVLPQGFYALGHYGIEFYEAPELSMLAIKPKTSIGSPRCAVAYPVDYRCIWRDYGAGSDSDGGLWEPIPPAGYKAMGCVQVNNSYDRPDLRAVVCVREDLVVRVNVGDLIWGDWGSKADDNVTVYTLVSPVVEKNYAYLTSGSFCGHASYNQMYQSNVAYALDVKWPLSQLFEFQRIDLANWMSFLPENFRLVDVALIASHDSASKCTDVLGDFFGSTTQPDNLPSQLRHGVRYFDLRVEWRDGQVKFHHGIAPGQGDESKVDYVFQNQIRPFIQDHSGEFLVFDISVNDGIEDQILELFRKHLNPDQWAAQEYLLPSGEFNPAVTLKRLRDAGRKYLITWDSKKYTHWSDTHETKLPWISWNEKTRWSPYEDKVYIDNPKLVPGFLDDRCKEWKRDKLFVAQVIATPEVSFFEHPSTLDTRYFHQFDQWTLKQAGGSNVNMIMRDFVDEHPEIVNKGIQLNLARTQNLFLYCSARLNKGERLNALTGNAYLTLQMDGNLVFYDKDGQPRWATGTQEREVTHVVMQEDGNLVIYYKDHHVWSSGTHSPNAAGGYFQIDLKTNAASIRRIDGTSVKDLPSK